jgi:tyrosyl-tRNA synthetase
MWRYLELLSLRPAGEIAGWRHEVDKGLNPMEVKFRLAAELVGRFHDDAAAAAARERFIARFRKGDIPDDVPEVRVSAPGGLAVANVLKTVGLVSSTSEALRLIQQGGVRVDNQRVEDKTVTLAAGSSYLIQVGKRRFARVALE